MKNRGVDFRFERLTMHWVRLIKSRDRHYNEIDKDHRLRVKLSERGWWSVKVKPIQMGRGLHSTNGCLARKDQWFNCFYNLCLCLNDNPACLRSSAWMGSKSTMNMSKHAIFTTLIRSLSILKSYESQRMIYN